VRFPVIHLHRPEARRNLSRTMAGSVIVPLYVYPSLGAWDPVYDMYVYSRSALECFPLENLIKIGLRHTHKWSSLP
jgi:hypothetical protein